MTVTDRDVRQRIINAVEAGGGELAADFNFDAITDEILATHGAADIDTIAAEEFWTIVARHDISA